MGKQWGGRSRGEVGEGASCRERRDEHRQELEDSAAGKGEGKQSYTIALLYKTGQQGI